MGSARLLEATFVAPLPGGPRFDVALLIDGSEGAVETARLVVERLDVGEPSLVASACDVERFGDADAADYGLILLSHLISPRTAEEVARVWSGISDWYGQVLGVDNSTLLAFDDSSRYVVMNYASIPGPIVRFMADQVLRPSFRSNVLGPLKTVDDRALPVFARRIHRLAKGGESVDVTVFGAAGPTGTWVCREALRAGHRVRAVSRRTDPLPDLSSTQLTQVWADATSGAGVRETVEGSDAVLSALGAAYTRHPVSVYSAGTQVIAEALRSGGRGNRLVAVGSGLTYPPPPGFGFIPDNIVFTLLRNVLGRTLYAGMRRMEEFLRQSDDVAWTIVRPGGLFDAPSVSAYRLDADHPTQGYTARADLAAAMG